MAPRRPAAAKPKAKPKKPISATAAAGRERWRASYGEATTGPTFANARAEVKGMSLKDRRKFFAGIEKATQADTTVWSGGMTSAQQPGVLSWNLPSATRAKTLAAARGGGGGGAGTALDKPLAPGVYGEADTSTTGYLRNQGKAYAAGRQGRAGTAAGATGKAGEKKKETGKKKPNRKTKGLLKTRGHRQQSGVKANFHINKAGKVVPNKGGQKAKPKGR